MILIKREDKIKTVSQAQNMNKWAIVAHEGDKEKGIHRGVYRVCPCCHYPLQLSQEDLRKLLPQLEGTVAAETVKSYMILLPDTSIKKPEIFKR